MSSLIVTVLLWAAALSSGLMAGIYFAFSGFIMRAFDNIDSVHSIAAMNSVNETILRSAFMPLFFGSSITSVLLIISGVFYWGEAGAGLMVLAGTVYFVGMFICTVLFNVPLNKRLERIKLSDVKSQQYWSYYLTTWTHWNHLRMSSSLVSCVLCMWISSNN